MYKKNKIKLLEIRINNTDLFKLRNDLVYVDIKNKNVIEEIYKGINKKNEIKNEIIKNKKELTEEAKQKIWSCIRIFLSEYKNFMKEFSEYFNSRSNDMFFNRLRPKNSELFASNVLNEWIKQTILYEYEFNEEEQKNLKRYIESDLNFDFRHFLRKIGFKVNWGI